MTILEKLALSEVPVDEQVFVNIIRQSINDTAELNVLERNEECSDKDIYHAILFTIDEINNTNQPILSNTSIAGIKDLEMLKLGVILKLLTTKGILSARNTLTYRDAGGITVQDYDKYGRYINYYNVLYNKYYEKLVKYKASLNMNAAWGGIGSDYSYEGE